VLFLHGSAERDDDGVAQSKVGLVNAVRKHADRFPAVVVMPQCRPTVRPDPPGMTWREMCPDTPANAAHARARIAIGSGLFETAQR
jgi:hypothetical protein